jgi:hypothetical protein
MFWLDLIGALASIAGLIVSVYVLRVAKGARRAAEEARILGRRRNLVEELDSASNKLQQVGSFLHLEQWVGVQIRIEEILTICRAAMTRWSDHLSEERKNDILKALSMIHSIATLSAQISPRAALPAEKKRFTATHLTASGLINSALGEARRDEERDGSSNGE